MMTKEQQNTFFLFLQKFCQDNIGNRINEWNAEAFLNRAHRMLDEIVKYDTANAAATPNFDQQ